MAEAWTVSRTANGINVIDENGLQVCTRVGLDDANLIASAPRLAEQVKLLREALVMIDKHPTNGNSEPDSMAEALEQIHALAEAALEATKEEA